MSLRSRRRLIFSFGRFNRPPRNFSSRQNGNDIPNFTSGIASRHGGPSPVGHRIVVRNVHHANVFRDDSGPFIVNRLAGRFRVFGLNDALDLHDFSAGGIRTADVLALKLGVEMIPLLATGADNGDMHGWGPSKQGKYTS